MSKKTKSSANADRDSGKVARGSKKVVQWIELAVAAALMLVLIALHFAVFLNSGPLWRDEVNILNFINQPSVADIWANLQFESFPMLWLLILRAWVFIGFGGTDLALRALGLIVGLGTLGALWYVARSLGTRLPLIALVLFAMSPTALIGDSLRAYGLGVLLILLALGAMWCVLSNPSPRRMLICAAALILSVHCLYNNSFLIFAICVGATAVGLYRRDWKLTIFPLGAGMLAAATLLPYFGVVSKANEFNIIQKVPVDLSWILDKFQQAIDPSGVMLTWIWALLALLSTVSLILLLIKSAPDTSGRQKDLALYLLTTMLVSIIAYIAFIKILSYPTQGWYYLPLIAVLIVIIDKGIDVICKANPPVRIIRIICVLGIAIFVFTNSWSAAHVRKTNMDVLAAKLETIADKNDLIIVSPFYYGVPFKHYYKGAAMWMTIPDITEQRIHRYDLFKIKMTQNEPIKSVLQKIISTLQTGHRVWVVGGLNFLRPDEIPIMLPPAPNSPYGWSEGAYQFVWSQQAAYILQTYGQTIEEVKISMDNPVNRFENMPLLVVKGWRR